MVTVLTSHYMQDIEELCKRVIVIDGGKIIFDGPLEGITARFAVGKVLQLEFTGRDGNRDFTGLGEVIARTDTSVQLRVPRDEVAAVCRRLFEGVPGQGHQRGGGAHRRRDRAAFRAERGRGPDGGAGGLTFTAATRQG